MKKILLLIFAVSLAGCATGKTAHHHHKPQFEGKCAYNVAHGKHDVDGSPEIAVEYKGKTYFFSSKDAKDHFLGEIKSSVKSANRKWHDRPVGGPSVR